MERVLGKMKDNSKIDKTNNKILYYKLTEDQIQYLHIKRIIDTAVSGASIVVLSPLLLGIAAVIRATSQGPALFKQTRVGKDKTFFEIYKFRTMYINTPKNQPTHMLADSDKYITKIGKFLRKSSLDELPQLFNILRGDMYIVGPRPALWNQNDLVEEREKYGVHQIAPGLTGWAQINGRDELKIPDKARLDGEYIQKLGLWMDIKCILGTVGSVLKGDGVSEGGLGRMDKNKIKTVEPENVKKNIMLGKAVSVSGIIAAMGIFKILVKKDTSIDDCSCLKNKDRHLHKLKRGLLTAGVGWIIAVMYTNIKRSVQLGKELIIDDDGLGREKPQEAKFPFSMKQKKILITGAGSYIGMAVEKWLSRYPDKYQADTLNMKGNIWENCDFSEYDTVFHVAGIAHADIGIVTKEQKRKYYKVNTQLAEKTARKAKADGVKQFIFMSSMIVYSGCGETLITRDTEPKAMNFYGESKIKAEEKIRALSDEGFKIVILRPPMIYGKNSKGNYKDLARLACKLPVFPVVNNQRSMLHIDNLCEFVRLMIDNQEEGIFFPQNREYTCTSDMVQMIAGVNGHRIVMLPGTNTVVKLMSRLPGRIGGLAAKAFGDLAYDMSMSEYKHNYRIHSLRRSIELTEK